MKSLVEEDIKYFVMLESLSVNPIQTNTVKNICSLIKNKIEDVLLNETPNNISINGIKEYYFQEPNSFQYFDGHVGLVLDIIDFPNEEIYSALESTYRGKSNYDAIKNVLTLTFKTIDSKIDDTKLSGLIFHELFHGFQLPKTRMEKTSNRIKYDFASASIGKTGDKLADMIYHALYTSFKTERDAYLNELYGEMISLPEDSKPEDYWEVINKSEIKENIDEYDELFRLSKIETNVRAMKYWLHILDLSQYKKFYPEIQELMKTGVSFNNFIKRLTEARKYYIRKMGHIIVYVSQERGISLSSISQLKNNG